MKFDRLSLTLVGPEYPINAGYIARLAKNFGISKMYLLEPRFDRRVASVYAAHGADILDDAEEVDWEQVRGRHDLLIATTAIAATRRSNIGRLTVSPDEVARYILHSKSASLVLGRDTTGLKNEEIARCDMATTVCTGTKYRTMNVSHSVAILLYVISTTTSKRGAVPQLAERDSFVRYAHELALASGLQKHRAERIRRLAGRVAIRSQLDDRELGLLISLMRRAGNALARSD